MKNSTTLMIGAALILYIALAYRNVPAPISSLLDTPIGKVLAIGLLVFGAVKMPPGLVFLSGIALLVSMPSLELMANKDSGKNVQTKPVGKNMQDRRATTVDVESKIRKPKITSHEGAQQKTQEAKAAASKPGAKLVPAAPGKETFEPMSLE